MNNLSKKISAFFIAAAMFAGPFQEALFAYTAVEYGLIRSWASTYIGMGTLADPFHPFDLATFKNEGRTPYSGNLVNASPSLTVFFLGATNEAGSLSTSALPPAAQLSIPGYTLSNYSGSYLFSPTSLSCNGVQIIANTDTANIMHGADVVLGSTAPLNFLATSTSILNVDSVTSNPVLEQEIPEFTTTIADDGFFQFYSLAGDISFGPWLGVYVPSVHDFTVTLDDGSPASAAVSLMDGWNYVGSDGNAYAELVFLFYPISPVPEPHIYLLLGTLLAGVGLMAYRRREQA